MKSRKIISLFSFVFLFGLFPIVEINCGPKLEGFKTFVKAIPGQLKDKINEINYDTSEGLDLVFKKMIKGRSFSVGVKVPWEPGTGDLSKGFPLTPVKIVSPTLGDLVPSLPGALGKARFAQILMGIGTRDEKNIAKASVVKEIMDPVKIVLRPVFSKFEKILFINEKLGLIAFKPVYIFLFKLIVLFKSYAKGRIKEIPRQLLLLFLRLLQSIDVDKTISANNGEMNPRNWSKNVFMSDPTSLIDTLPRKIKELLIDVKVPVPFSDYQKCIDEKSGVSEYGAKISEVFKRKEGNSRLIASIREIEPLFESENLIPYYASLLAYICGDLVYHKSKISSDIIERLSEFLNSARLAISNMVVGEKLEDWHDGLVSFVDSLIDIVDQGKSLEKEPVFDEIGIQGMEKISLVSAVPYYFNKIKFIMKTPFHGDDGYLFVDYKIGDKQAVASVLLILFRVYKDLRVALSKAMKIDTWKKQYGNSVGKPGKYDSVSRKWKTAGSGSIFEVQKATIEYKLKTNTANKKALVKAKALFAKAKAEFKMFVMKGFSFKRAKNIDEETIWNFLLREIKKLLLRTEDAKPIIDGINSSSKELFGVPFIEDADKFEEELPSEEDVYGDDEFGFEEDFDEFAF